MREKIQLTYIFTFLISLLGLAGNIELGVKTPIHCWVIIIISGFLTVGKFYYSYKSERRR